MVWQLLGKKGALNNVIETNKSTIAALDIGTAKVVALVATVDEAGKLDVIGVGHCASKGLRKGLLVNMDATAQAVQQALNEAQTMAGFPIHSVFTGIAGNHIRSFNSNGIVAIRDQEISVLDVDRVVEAARAVAIPVDQKVLHVLPQEFIIDHEGGIRTPLGMSGVRLEAKVHMVTAAVAAAQQIVKCIARSAVEVEELVLEQLASSEAVLTEDEKALGVCLVDIGGGTTDIAIFVKGAVRHTAVIPVAGDQVTNDIAVALKTPTQHAERIKIQHGCALEELADAEASIEVPSLGDRAPRAFSQAKLATFIEPRFEELFALVQAEIRRHGLEDSLGSGIVLTGGSVRMPGVVALAEEVFRLPVRLGIPRDVSGLTDVVRNPVYATAIGLLRYGYGMRAQWHRAESQESPAVRGLWGRMRNWFRGHF